MIADYDHKNEFTNYCEDEYLNHMWEFFRSKLPKDIFTWLEIRFDTKWLFEEFLNCSKELQKEFAEYQKKQFEIDHHKGE